MNWRERCGTMLRVLRLARGLSQFDFGLEVGLSQCAVARIERAQMLPSPPTIQKFCSGLGIDAQAFIFLAEKIP